MKLVPMILATYFKWAIFSLQLLRHRADVTILNEHGNSALHYACFWGYEQIAEDLINAGSSVTIANKYGDVPLDKCKGAMAKRLHGRFVRKEK